MNQSEVSIIHLKDKSVRHYTGLSSNDEVEILMWLHKQGFDFERISGVESHDIGDQDYFHGSEATNSIDEIAAFCRKLYGEWSLQSLYHGISIRVEKRYPNIHHGISFYYPEKLKKQCRSYLASFKRNFVIMT